MGGGREGGRGGLASKTVSTWGACSQEVSVSGGSQAKSVCPVVEQQRV